MAINLLEHPSFPQPTNVEDKIWRYLSLSKFLDFFLSQSLYFARIDLLEDHHEGTYTKINKTQFRMGTVQIPSGLSLTEADYTKRVRQSQHVNCWRLDNHESEAMWKIYCDNNAGLAIQTTYKKLADSLPKEKHMFMGLVTYLDYEIGTFDPTNNFNAAMHKRIAFEHEKEIRIVKGNINYMNDHNLPMADIGLRVKTTLLQNIESIYVNPYAEEWYFQTIQKLFEHLNITIPLKWSEIKSDINY